MGEPQYMLYPDLSLAQIVFQLASPSTTQAAKHEAKQTIQDALRDHKMAPLYAYLAHPQTGKLNSGGESGAALSPIASRSQGFGAAVAPDRMHLLRRTSSINTPGILGVLGGNVGTEAELGWDESSYNELKAANDTELAAIQKEEDEAVEKAGETEITTARGKRAEFYARVGDKENAIKSFEALFEHTGILGTKIDIVLAIIRIALFFDDKPLTKKSIDRAKMLVESGGDWDRRNRLKAYEGLHLLTVRSHNLAAPLLLDSLSTFTSTELCPYSSLVVYATLAGSVSLPRREFKSRVVDAPEIRAIFGSDNADSNSLAAFSGASKMDVDNDDTPDNAASSVPKPSTAVNLTTLASGSQSAAAQQKAEPVIDFKPLATMIQALYTGNYSGFFGALARVEQEFLGQDRYLYEHKGWFVHEMRLRAYAQLLQSYKVVSIKSMAGSFGISEAWLDRDLAPFIASQRLPCTIDRVKGIIETQRAGDKNRQYGDVVKQGDQLITKLQKYGQVVRLRGSERG